LKITKNGESSLMVTEGGAQQEPAHLMSFSTAEIDLIKQMSAKGCSDAEFALLLRTAEKLGLDPLPPAREVWCIKRSAGDPALIMTSRDGLLKVAQRDPLFDGLSAGVVREGDHFAFDAANGIVEHKFGSARGAILGAWGIAWAKGRRPVSCFVDFKEYNGTSPVWRGYPSAMIQKVAEVFVLRRQFGVSGIVTREEMDASEAPEPARVSTPTRQELPPGRALMSPAQERVKKACEVYGVPLSAAPLLMDASFKKSRADDLTPEEMASLCERLIPGEATSKAPAIIDAEPTDDLPIYDGQEMTPLRACRQVSIFDAIAAMG
jgi:hypothetical protein